jgi:UDP-N-acetylglucosamine--N-acetylmuramyl-(pentapeptide) pyrophosphoryl-undecaprenol N-acetylglucosamine transferase
VNRVLGRVATACAVAFPDTALPRATVTGAAVRQEIAAIVHSPEAQAGARRALGLPADRRTLCVFGGSIGARRINQATVALARAWAGRDDVAIYQVTGRQGHDEVLRALGEGMPEGPLVHRVVPFEEHMALLYQAADLVVCRAGAMTVAELAAAGVPSVLVPLPGAPGDHQTANARVLERAGVTGPLLEDPAGLSAMGKAAATLGRADAAERIADLVEEVAGAGRP